MVEEHLPADSKATDTELESIRSTRDCPPLIHANQGEVCGGAMHCLCKDGSCNLPVFSLGFLPVFSRFSRAM
jgi:hypothetical protein